MRIHSLISTTLIGGLLAFTMSSCSQGGDNTSGKGSGDAATKSMKSNGSEGNKNMDGNGQSGQGMSATSPMKGGNADFSDKELKEYIRISQQLRPLQMEARKKMREEVSSSDMGMKRYMEIAKAQQKGQNPKMSDKEKSQMDSIKKNNREIQAANQKKIQKKVESEGMKWERFMKINQALRSNPQVKKRMKSLMNQQQGGQGRPSTGGGGTQGGATSP